MKAESISRGENTPNLKSLLRVFSDPSLKDISMMGSEILEGIRGSNNDETSLWSDIHVKTIAEDLIYL